MKHRRRKAKRPRQSAKPSTTAKRHPTTAAVEPSTTATEPEGATEPSSNCKTRKSRLSAEQVELIEKLLVIVLGSIEPANKLIEILVHLLR